MKRSKLLEIIKQVLSEDGAMGNVTGAVGGYLTPKAFAKKGAGAKAATKASAKLGFKAAPRPKRPSNTKMFEYLDEMHFGTPHAFVTEEEMENSNAVKKTLEMGYKKVNKTNKASDKESK